VTGSFALWGHADEENERFCNDIYRLASQYSEVRLARRLPKEEVAKLQAQSEVMLYPTDFDEMFCISALECQALGVPIIATRRAAMAERVDDGHTGFLIDGIPGHPSYSAAFINAATKILMNHSLWSEFSAAAALSCPTYDDVALEWEQEIHKRLGGSVGCRD
jgi:glycosyltransferase involved in cell wall biosynthesis